MPKREVHNFGPREEFVEVFAVGTETVVSPKGNPGLRIEVTEIDEAGNLHGFVTERVGTGEKGFEIPLKGLPGDIADLFRGPGEGEEEVEEDTFAAEFLSMDPSDPKTLARLITNQSLATLTAKFADNPEALNEEGAFELWMNLAQLEQGFATDQELAAAAMSALGMGYQEMFASGELDDPDKAEAAAQTFAQHYQALKGLGEAALEAEVGPEDELTALYEQQVKEQAEFEQMGFYRAGIMDLVSLAPPEARLGLMAGMLENPEIGKMFFPKPPEPARRTPWSPENPLGGLPTESKFEIR